MEQFVLDFYQRLGINKAMAEDLEAITFAMIFFVLALGIWLVTRRVFRVIFSNISKRTKSKFDDYLIQNKIPETLSYFPSLILLISFLPPSLQSFPIFEKLSGSLLNILGAIITIFLVRRLLNSIKDFLKTLKNFKDKPIDSYIQVVMIFLWFIGGIIILSILTETDIGTFLTTLGALSAVLLFVFKDKAYFYYVIFCISIFFWNFTFRGFSFQYIWGNSVIWNNKALLIGVSMGLFFIWKFCVHFLKLPAFFPKMFKFFNIINAKINLICN